MKVLTLDLSKYDEKFKGKKPPHQLSATVDLLIEEIGTDKRYGYGYWLKKVKQSGLSYGDMEGIIKTARGLPKKYNSKGFIINKICLRKNDTKKLAKK